MATLYSSLCGTPFGPQRANPPTLYDALCGADMLSLTDAAHILTITDPETIRTIVAAMILLKVKKGATNDVLANLNAAS